MKSIPLSMVKTWLFLAQSTDAQLGQAKFLAHRKLKTYYGSVELARIYVEQQQDKDIEIVVI